MAFASRLCLCRRIHNSRRVSRPARSAPPLLDLRHTAAGFWEPREDQRIVPRRNQPRVGGETSHSLLRFEIGIGVERLRYGCALFEVFVEVKIVRSDYDHAG